MDALDLIKVKPLLNGHQPMASASGSYQEEHIIDWASRNAIMQFEGRCLKSSSRRGPTGHLPPERNRLSSVKGSTPATLAFGFVRGLDLAAKAQSPDDSPSLGDTLPLEAPTATSVPPHEPAVPPRHAGESEEEEEHETGPKEKKRRRKRKDKDKVKTAELKTAEMARQKGVTNIRTIPRRQHTYTQERSTYRTGQVVIRQDYFLETLSKSEYSLLPQVRFLHSCPKYFACHEKKMPGHTKCCTCHAKSSCQN